MCSNTNDCTFMADAKPQLAPQNISGEPLSLVLGLLHDPKFLQFESELEEPNVFHVVGRTFTETWHSTLLGWLFHPQSSHGLGDYPLKRLILLSSNESELSAHEWGIDLDRLLVQGDFLQATAKPNEQEPKEISVENVGRFGVFIEKILLSPWKEIRVLVETKIKDAIKIEQCNRYISYIEKNKQEGIFTIPVFIAPQIDLWMELTPKNFLVTVLGSAWITEKLTNKLLSHVCVIRNLRSLEEMC
jgi:PD-(D/E)XK nuclease superfamily protein